MASLAAYRELLCHMQPKLALPEALTEESFKVWRKQVQQKYRELLCMPEFTKQPAPVQLSCEKRDGYRIEKWEFYPDDYTAVPFLVLIPDGVNCRKPAPGVLCIPGSTHSKELLAGEPFLDFPNCQCSSFPDRNKMAYHMVKNGMVAFAFDNIATAERGLPVEEHEKDVYNFYSRTELCHGYLHGGFCYPGMSTFHLLCFLKEIHRFEYVDRDRLAVSGHSLGTEPAMALGVLCDEIKAVVFNDFLHSDRDRFVSVTESEEGKMGLNPGNWHLIPGFMQHFDFPDLCAAMAPKYLAFNEGGAEQYFEKVKRAYDLFGAAERLQIIQYPRYQQPESRIYQGEIPLKGLSSQGYLEHCYCDARDHSFRAEPSVRLLKKCFGC